MDAALNRGTAQPGVEVQFVPNGIAVLLKKHICGLGMLLLEKVVTEKIKIIIF